MTKPDTSPHARLIAAFLALASPLVAQIAPTTSPANEAPQPAIDAKDDELVVLNTFEVSADRDNSYGALDSNSLAAFRMELAKVPATAEVFTQAFMDDIGATSIEEALTGYAGTITAASNNPGAGLYAPGDRDGSQGLSIRGVSAGEVKRDGFIGVPNNARTASGNTDNFSIERVDVISGPQSILYGSVGGGGVINSVSKRAQFGRQRTLIRATFDQYGTKRGMVDHNYGSKKVAARVVLAGADNRTNRYRLGGDFYGIYAQLAFQPLRNTTIRFSTEKTDNNANVGFRPNLNAFLAPSDPRRNKDARYLVLTNQVSDIRVYDEPLTYGNLESAAAWFSSERIETHWNQMLVETKLPFGFSAQLVGIYSETVDTRVTDGRNLLPGRTSTLPDGTPNTAFGANPFNETAVAIGAPVQVNEQRDRNKGVRLSLVHEKEFSIGNLKGKSQSAFGGQAFHRGPTFGSSGIANVYYRADENFNVLYTSTNGTVSNTPQLNRSDYGRTPLQNVYFPVQGKIPEKPLFRPGTKRITYNGQNYVLDPRIYSSPDYVSERNPFGLVPNNNPATGTFTGNWNRGGETHSGNVYFANFTDWADGRLTTLVGYSITRFETMNAAQGFVVSPTPKDDHAGYQVGVNARLVSWLRGYAVVGTAEQAEASTNDILGNPLKNPEAQSLTPEFGLKATLLEGRFSAQLSYNPSTKTLNENKDAGTAFRDAINPDGINGRVGGNSANQRVNIDRSLSSQELTVSAEPIRNWTVRMKLTRMDGEISNDVIYKQNYNDQFHLNGGGVVTYGDGTPVMVNGAGSLLPAAPRDTQLTLAMINNSTNPYYANPDPQSGRIQNTTLRTVLMTPDPTRGTAATGVTGLPISSVQYNFVTPYGGGNVPVFLSGEKNVGFNEYTFNIQNKYKFASGFAKGLSLMGDVQTYAKNRAYYTSYPSATGSTAATQVTRVLYRYPNVTTINLGIGYSRDTFKLFGKKVTWSSQVNIRNALNHYKVWVVPNSTLGTNLNARLSAQPRSIAWTNSIDF
jgi:outer membrane receptor protein involved in Fe transport